MAVIRVVAAAELPQEAPAFEGSHSAFTEAADLGVIVVVMMTTPAAQVLASERDADSRACALIPLVSPALDVVSGESGGNAVGPGRGQIVRGSG